MTNDAFLLMQGWINGIWRLFTSWYIPGTRFTVAQWLFFLLVLPFTVTAVKAIITFGFAEMFRDNGGSVKDKKK